MIDENNHTSAANKIIMFKITKKNKTKQTRKTEDAKKEIKKTRKPNRSELVVDWN